MRIVCVIHQKTTENEYKPAILSIINSELVSLLLTHNLFAKNPTILASVTIAPKIRLDCVLRGSDKKREAEVAGHLLLEGEVNLQGLGGISL